MKVTNNLFEGLTYVSPSCKIKELKSKSVFCASNYGDTGQAGPTLSDDDIINYGEDF